MASVRSARPEDSRRLAEIHVTSWREAYQGLLPDEFLRALSVDSRHEWWSRRLTALEKGGDVLIVADSDIPEGFAFLGPCSETEGEIYAIYIDPRRWRLGLGTELLGAAERALDRGGFSQAILWVLEGNHRVRSFYENQGWRPDGALKIEEIGGSQVTELRYRKNLRNHGDHQPPEGTFKDGTMPATENQT
jgi:GNAT superfamily N-acetyltransferase